MSVPVNSLNLLSTSSLTAANASQAIATAAGTLRVQCADYSTGGVQLTGTFSGTVQFEQSSDGGATWNTKMVFPIAGGAAVTSATATGNWKFTIGGMTHFQVRCSAFVSGTIVVAVNTTMGVDPTVGVAPAGEPEPVYTPLTLRATDAAVVTASSAYASGNCVGALRTFAGMARASGQGGILQSAIVRDKAGQSGSYDLILFDANPTSTTVTDKTAVAINTADLAKVIGVIQFSGIVLGASATMGVLSTKAIGLAFKLSSGTTIFGILVTRGTPTYAATADVSVDLVALPD